jgi:multicomponent Na+:H+ antiporter subunit C
MSVYIYWSCFVLMLIGLYCLMVKKNIFKAVIGVAIMEYAANMFLIMLGYVKGGVAPIVTGAGKQILVDPLPQAVVMTSIIISLATLIFMVAVSIRIYDKHGTFDISEIRDLKG